MKKEISPKTYRFAGIRRQFFPVFIWLLVVACSAGLFLKRKLKFEVIGLVQVQTFQVAATTTERSARLESVPVKLFGEIEKGQVVAILSDERLKKQMATAAAEIDRLRSEIMATQDRLIADEANREADWISRTRMYSVDVERTRIRILELKSEMGTDRILLEDLKFDLEIVKSLVGKDDSYVLSYELPKAQVQFNALLKKIEENQQIIEQLEQDLSGAELRRDEYARRHPVHPSLDRGLDLIRKTITVQERYIDELSTERESLIIKSPCDGIVSQLLKGPGEIVLPGDPFMTIASNSPKEIVAYLSENQINMVRQGMPVELAKNSDPAKYVKSEVTYVGPSMQELPMQLWRNPNLPQWGRPLLIKVPPGWKLVPGETLGVRGI